MNQTVEHFLKNIWMIWLEAAPWLLFGLIIAGLIKAWFPTRLLSRWLGGRGLGPVLKAAIIGTPVPLCSCSVIPAAIALRRGGASKGATVSFLVSTPENGADSLALSYALLGPFMTIVRPVAAIISAVFAGLLTSFMEIREPKKTESDVESKEKSRGVSLQVADGGADAHTDAGDQGEPESCCAPVKPCCASKAEQSKEAPQQKQSFFGRTANGVKYAAVDLLGDIIGWLLLGVLIAAALRTFISPEQMTDWGSGLPAMLAMLAIGIPMYICATASTPVAAAMIAAGVSPGTALVFLLAGPATNMATMGIIRREMGTRTLVAYLIGITVTSIGLGLATDWVAKAMSINVITQIQDSHKMLPHWLSMTCGFILIALTLRYLAQRIYKRLQKSQESKIEPAPAQSGSPTSPVS